MLEDFSLFNIASRVASSTIGANIIPVKPMGAPTSSVFYMDNTSYASSHANIALALLYRNLINPLKQWEYAFHAYNSMCGKGNIYSESKIDPTEITFNPRKISIDVTFKDTVDAIDRLMLTDDIIVEECVDVTKQVIHDMLTLDSCDIDDAGEYFYNAWGDAYKNHNHDLNVLFKCQDYGVSTSSFYLSPVSDHAPSYFGAKEDLGPSDIIHINPDERLFNARIILSPIIMGTDEYHRNARHAILDAMKEKRKEFFIYSVDEFISEINFFKKI